MAESETYRTDLALASNLDAPSLARRFVVDNSDHLAEHLVQDAELLVSELVTNAVLHGRPQITLRVDLEPPFIGVSVTDRGEDFAAPDRLAAHNATHGRGLRIVAAVAREHGVAATPEGEGKTVWFELTARDHG